MDINKQHLSQTNSLRGRIAHLMKVTIIGAGNVGKALGTSIGRAGHDVTISASTPESANAAAREIGAKPADTNVDAVVGADIVILAVPFVGVGEIIANETRGEVAAKRVIDATTPLKPDCSGLATKDSWGAEEFQRQLPEAKV